MDFEHEIESLVVRSSALNCENANENNNHSDSNLKEPLITLKNPEKLGVIHKS